MPNSFLNSMILKFSENSAVDWLRNAFPAFTTLPKPINVPADNERERKNFSAITVVGHVEELRAKDTTNHPLLVVVTECRDKLAERTSRTKQFDLAKRLLKSAAAGTLGLPKTDGLVAQGLFFYFDSDGTFRLSYVRGAVEKRAFKFGSARRQSFLVVPARHNNTFRRRFEEPVRDFAALEAAFSVEALTKEFYGQLFTWFEMAVNKRNHVSFPNYIDDPDDDRNNISEAVIRLITRLMFVWFVKEKGIIPEALFDEESVGTLLKDFKPRAMDQTSYYHAILQNLFFATLNCPVGLRKFSQTSHITRNPHHGIKTFWRYWDEFNDPQAMDSFAKLLKKVPFLNCALFECLDKDVEDEETGTVRRLLADGFSDNRKDKNGVSHQCFVPNGLFFRADKTGLVDIFKLYEFTVDENTGNDADIALDPELLGKVFENLLGAYNPETQETARKATGSFYTPREIVDYMVRESLRNYLKGKVPALADAELDALFDVGDDPDGSHAALAALLADKPKKSACLDALYGCRVLDPACGSGAFPMGVLHAMTRLFSKLDPDNLAHLARVNASYKKDMAELDQGLSAAELADRKEQIEAAMREGTAYPDYARKLYLIENCIYGVDIQPIATQISKLRFFISLLCDQLRSNYDAEKENYNLLSLPNLEAKFVCANTLIPLPKLPNGTLDLATGDVKDLRLALQKNRHVIFNARTAKTKGKYKEEDVQIRKQIRAAVRDAGSKPDAEKIARLSAEIAKFEAERVTVAESRMVEFDGPKVQALPGFGEPQQGVLKLVDANAKRRNEIDDQLRSLKKALEGEQNKKANKGSTELDTLANLVAGWDPYDQNASSKFFDPEWMFNVTTGFDVVIGNPPYISAPAQVKDEKLAAQREFLAKSGLYKTLYQKWDLYIPFMEFGITHLAKGGAFAMIVPYPLSNQIYARSFREWVLKNYRVPEIADLHETKVFENATVSNVILFAENAAPTDKTIISTANEAKQITPVFTQKHADMVIDAKNLVWNLTQEKRATNRHAGMHVLGDFCYISYGLAACADEKVARGLFKKEDLLSPTKDKIHCRYWVEGKDIERYRIKSHQFIEYGTKRSPGQLRRQTFPAFYEHPKLLSNDLGVLRATIDDSLFALHDHTIIGSILWSDLHGVDNKSITGSITKFSKLTRAAMEQLSHSINLRFIVGVVNSKYEATLLTDIRGGDFHIYPEHIRNLPIPDATAAQQAPIIARVDKILAAKAKDPAADTSKLEAEIDQLVYKLYGLTPEEIAVVEGSAKPAAEVPPKKGGKSAAHPAKATAAAKQESPDDWLE